MQQSVDSKNQPRNNSPLRIRIFCNKMKTIGPSRGRGEQDAWRVFCLLASTRANFEFRLYGEARGVGPRLVESELQIWTQLKVYRVEGGCRLGSQPVCRPGVESAIKAKHYITIATEGWHTTIPNSCPRKLAIA